MGWSGEWGGVVRVARQQALLDVAGALGAVSRRGRALLSGAALLSRAWRGVGAGRVTLDRPPRLAGAEGDRDRPIAAPLAAARVALTPAHGQEVPGWQHVRQAPEFRPDELRAEGWRSCPDSRAALHGARVACLSSRRARRRPSRAARPAAPLRACGSPHPAWLANSRAEPVRPA